MPLSRTAARRAGVVLCALAFASPLHAQRTDSARVAPKAAPKPAPVSASDSALRAIPRAPLSPRQAFLYSLLLPGYSQSRLGRPTAGAIFTLTEAISIAMLRESAADLREAKRFRTDSLVVVGYDPNGTPITERSAYSDEIIRIRKGHVEDWIAFIVANHLFAAADGYVAAHLWDLPSQINVTQAPGGGTVVAARIKW